MEIRCKNIDCRYMLFITIMNNRYGYTYCSTYNRFVIIVNSDIKALGKYNFKNIIMYHFSNKIEKGLCYGDM